MKCVFKVVVVAASICLVQGCAMLGAERNVSDADIISRTESAIGVPSSNFTISNRVNEGVTARYKVMTKSGKQYNCFVGGSLTGIGKSVSEAVCTALDGSGEVQTPKKPCDALSRAAGRC